MASNMGSRMTNILRKTKCQYCDKEFTLQNIKRHEKSCEHNSREPVKVKLDVNGHGKEMIKENMTEVGYEQLTIAEEVGMNYFRHMHVYTKIKSHWTYENLSKVITQELLNRNVQKYHVDEPRRLLIGQEMAKIPNQGGSRTYPRRY